MLQILLLERVDDVIQHDVKTLHFLGLLIEIIYAMSVIRFQISWNKKNVKATCASYESQLLNSLPSKNIQPIQSKGMKLYI